MIKITNLNVLKEVVSALIDCNYNISIKVIPDEFLLYEVDHYEIDIEKVELWIIHFLTTKCSAMILI